MIEVCELVKDYAGKRAVNQLSFTAHPGMVTGFVGPSGAGKSTTMRIILGLDAPTSGTALVNGRSQTTLEWPMQTVGALLDTGMPAPRSALAAECSATDHLRFLARTNGISRHRVAEVLEEVELSEVARQRIGDLSPGMRQRLGIAGALLGDPGVLLFDEPMHGLDPAGIQWIRDLMQSLADQGRTVLVSSTHLSEMAVTADRLLIINRGLLIMEAVTGELMERFQRDVLVRSPRRSGLTRVLTSMGAIVRAGSEGGLSVIGMDSWRIASAAAEHHIPIQELTPRSGSLEDFYGELTSPELECDR
ncbi:MAG: ATP-binding cassette domain-containing protein [Pseudonocardiaceae bacterium]